MQQWTDTLPETLRRFHLASQSLTRTVNFLSLRWFDAVMIAMRPFLASLVRFGVDGLPTKICGFFQFAAKVASIAARESLSLLRHMENQRMIRGLLAFEKHFVLQSATVLALSSVVLLGKRDERLRFRECIEMMTRLPGAKHERLIKEMRTVEGKLEKLAIRKKARTPYFL
jgi:hypothetical protein